MKERNEQLLALRPLVPKAKTTEQTGAEEHFQNTTLRPILKLQNDLLLQVFQQYIARRKNTFHQLSLEKRLAYISNALQRDIRFRNIVLGMVIGHFTVQEHALYSRAASAHNKRIASMAITRIQDQLQYFEKNASIQQ
ncbi:glyoxalase [Maribacter sp. 2307ULW6-5]|uniref:glyoxalase n=1 Tax=Maribacter sp. 2307ULW6-5 TaxID=3386275 RepID=UPI0039BC7FE3